MYIASQIFAVVALICVFISFQWKKKSTLLVWSALTNVCLAISYLLLLDWIGFALLTVATVRCICFFFLRKEESKVPQWISICCLFLFLIAHCISTALLWSEWYDFVLLAGIIFLTFGLWTKGGNLVRIATLTYASLMIVHNIAVHNWMALMVDIVTIISIFIYYIRNWRNRYVSKSIIAVSSK